MHSTVESRWSVKASVIWFQVYPEDLGAWQEQFALIPPQKHSHGPTDLVVEDAEGFPCRPGFVYIIMQQQEKTLPKQLLLLCKATAEHHEPAVQ